MNKNQKSGRFYFRLFVVLYCLPLALADFFIKRKRPEHPQSFLIAHHLLLGDTLMLTPMLAKLRRLYPKAVIYFLVPEQYAGLYEKLPYQVKALAYDARNARSYFGLRKIVKSVDMAFIPGDNRFSSLAYSLKSKWIVAFEDLASERLKNIFVDEFVPIPNEAVTWEDMNLQLIQCKQHPADNEQGDFFYNKKDWLSPGFEQYQRPENYVVLHVGASNPLRYWQEEKWLDLASKLEALGYQVVWTASPKEEWLIRQIDPQNKFPAYCNLSLAQLWNLIECAEMVICPDTGVSHLAKLTNTPVVVLFGQGSDVLFGKGSFFKQHIFYKAIIIENIPCRNQNFLFKRPISWVRRCSRSTKECDNNLCMRQIDVDMVYKAALEYLDGEKVHRQNG